MTDREIGNRLVGEAGLAPEGPRACTHKEAAHVVKRARRRACIVGGVAVALWSLVAVGFFSMVYAYFVFFHPIFIAAIEGEKVEVQLAEAVRLFPYLAVYGAAIWGAILVLAAAATVMFVVVSRQTTLRQIQASLAEISARIKA